MRGIKGFFVLIFTGCLLLFSAIFLSGSVYEKIKELNGQVSMNKVSISLTETSRSNGDYFSGEDIKDLKKLLGTDIISYSAQEKTFVSYNANTVDAGIVGTDELAPMFENIAIIKGAFFSEVDCREKSRVIVIDSDTAWKLFNNDDVLGCSVDVFGSRLKIIGVVKSDGSIIGRLTNDQSVKAYIPIQTYMDICSNSGITYVQFKADSGNMAGKSTDDAASAMLSIGKYPANYNLKDYSIKGVAMEQKPAIMLFLMGLFVISVLSIYAIRFLMKLIQDIKIECKTDYLINVVKAHRFKIVKALILLALTGSVSVLVWNLIRFGIYVSPDLISDDFTDISYYLDLIFEKVSGYFSTDVRAVPFQEIRSNAAEAVFNLVFYFGFIVGVLLFYAGLMLLKRLKISLENALLICGAALAAALGICALMALPAGFPVVIDLKGIIIYWSFVFANLVLFSTEGKGMVKEPEEVRFCPETGLNMKGRP
ncbi:MAG TPA: ABC transporter permease [Clostridia bacterium]|nr:ABC transporter permease [Clostridia bacterium]